MLYIKLLQRRNFKKCAMWDYTEGYHLYPNDILVETEDIYRKRVGSMNIPLTYTAIYYNKLIGMISVVMDNKLPNYSHFYPWISALYVTDKMRKLGVASKLLQTAENHVKEDKYPFIYLWTDSKNLLFFQNRQYSIVEESVFIGKRISVLKKDLNEK